MSLNIFHAQSTTHIFISLPPIDVRTQAILNQTLYWPPSNFNWSNIIFYLFMFFYESSLLWFPHKREPLGLIRNCTVKALSPWCNSLSWLTSTEENIVKIISTRMNYSIAHSHVRKTLMLTFTRISLLLGISELDNGPLCSRALFQEPSFTRNWGSADISHRDERQDN